MLRRPRIRLRLSYQRLMDSMFAHVDIQRVRRITDGRHRVYLANALASDGQVVAASDQLERATRLLDPDGERKVLAVSKAAGSRAWLTLYCGTPRPHFAHSPQEAALAPRLTTPSN